MPRFVVERPLPNMGDATEDEKLSMAKVGNEIIDKIGRENIQWIESIFTPDKAYCIYDARDAETVREFSEVGGFPYDRISEVRYVLDSAALSRNDQGDDE
jgi:hypothetical protein